MGTLSFDPKLDLKVGEWVVIRSAEEILSTLDSNARFQEVPFMPQMLQYCGMKFQVRKRAHKLCDTAFSTGGRRMADAVFLEDIRCDGQAFGGCEMKCPVIWKEAWLRRANQSDGAYTSAPIERLVSLVWSGTRRSTTSEKSNEPLYVCQATQVASATELLPVWHPFQYIEDYRSGNVSLSQIISRLLFEFYAQLVASGVGLGSALRWIYNVVQSVRGGVPYPVRRGVLPAGGPTPAVNLELKVGELVRVKDGDAILNTVDERLSNRGLSFHPEMMPYCGKTFRVKERVRKIINEKTGQLMHLKNSCLILEGVECHGRYTRPLNCPRGFPPYWREIWLERVDSTEVQRAGETATQEDTR